MPWQPDPYEWTTGLTNVMVSFVCLLCTWFVSWDALEPRWRRALWAGVFAGVGIAALGGFFVHAIVLPEEVRWAVWRWIFLSALGGIASLVLAAVYDALDARRSRTLAPFVYAGAVILSGVPLFLENGFAVVLLAEAAGVLFACGLYLRLLRKGSTRGAGIVFLGLVLHLAAAGIQVGGEARVGGGIETGAPLWLDHRGLFHLALIPAFAVLGAGARLIGASLRSADVA